MALSLIVWYCSCSMYHLTMKNGPVSRRGAAARASTPLALAALLLLGALAVALPGCGGSSSASASRYNLFETVGARLASRYRISGEGVVAEGLVQTYRTGEDLAGILPAVKPAVLTRGNTNAKRVALTIDDGWNADMRILDLLRGWKIRFTTFLIADRGVAEAHPEFVKAIHDGGGEVCSHTYSHYLMLGKDEAFVMNEIWKSQDVITKTTHEVLPYIRFCGGNYDKNSLDWTAREGFWVVNWSIDCRDTAAGISVDAEVNNILGNLSPGAIILCHWGGHNTYDVLARAIPEIQRRGYEVTSLSRVMEGTPYYLEGSTGSGEKKSGGTGR